MCDSDCDEAIYRIEELGAEVGIYIVDDILSVQTMINHIQPR